MTRARTRVLVVAVATALALFAAGVISSAASTAGPGPFVLVFEGRHELIEGLEDAGFWHVGAFTASSPFCSSGRVTAPAPNALFEFGLDRVLACDDGSGSIVARVTPESGEHGGTGTWRIISGTGDYAKLRGQGSFASVQTGGDPRSADHGSIAFRSTWSGAADLDDLAPAIDISSATAKKLRRPAGEYAVTVALALRDEVEGSAVSYALRAVSTPSARMWPNLHFELASRTGTASTGTVSVTLRVRPNSPRAREIRLRLTASDQVGNESSTSLVVDLPRR